MGEWHAFVSSIYLRFADMPSSKPTILRILGENTIAMVTQTPHLVLPSKPHLRLRTLGKLQNSCINIMQSVSSLTSLGSAEA